MRVGSGGIGDRSGGASYNAGDARARAGAHDTTTPHWNPDRRREDGPQTSGDSNRYPSTGNSGGDVVLEGEENEEAESSHENCEDENGHKL